MSITRWEAVAFEVLAELHAQNRNTSNPMLAELGSPTDTIEKGNKRWAAAVAGLLMLAAVAYEEPKPYNESQPKTPAGENTQHHSWGFLDR